MIMAQGLLLSFSPSRSSSSHAPSSSSSSYLPLHPPSPSSFPQRTQPLHSCSNCLFCSSFALPASRSRPLKRLNLRFRVLCRNLKPTGFAARVGSQLYQMKQMRHKYKYAWASSPNGGNFSSDERPMRKVVEHIVLFQMQKSFTEAQEEDMLDHLYTLQYLFRGILAISLGRLAASNAAQCTHGLFVRFPSRELLSQYMDHPARWKVAKEFIIPFYKGLIIVDFESFVRSDIGPLFRRGEEYESGIEYVLLFEAKKNVNTATVNDVIEALTHLQDKLRQLVVQVTAGENFSLQNQGFTHALFARLPSVEAFDAFKSHPAYISIVSEKVLPISNKMLSVHFHVDPVGTTIPQ